MKPIVRIIAGDIINAEEKAVIVPCSTHAEKQGRGTDAAIYEKFPAVRESFIRWFRRDNHSRILDFGETFVAQEYGKIFILVAVPPMNESNYYYCNLETCYANAFAQALDHGCGGAACPLLGTGQMNWPLSEAFFSLYDVLSIPQDPRLTGFNVTLYLKNNDAIDYARKNDWDIARCFDPEPLDKRIDFLRSNGYEITESTFLQGWYAEKEWRKQQLEKNGPPKNNRAGNPERETRFLLASRALEQLSVLKDNSGRALTQDDIVCRSGLDRNLVGQIFSGGGNACFTREQIIAFGYAMQCSYALMCGWLKMLGMCFGNSDRDRFIEDAFMHRTSNDVRYLNVRLKNHGFPPLPDHSDANAANKFSGELNRQLGRIKKLSGNALSNKELAQKSGMTENDISHILGGAAKFVPKKDKIVSLAAALRCSTAQLEEWLRIFGLSLSDSKRDALIRKAFDGRSVKDANELNSLLLKNGHGHLQVTVFNREHRSSRAVDR